MLEIGTRVRVRTDGIRWTERGYVGTVLGHTDDWNVIDFDPGQGPVVATEFYDNELVVLTDET
jgi:hypothetical protein